VKSAAQTQTVFDQNHYLQIIEARGRTIRDVVGRLRPLLGLSTALDAGCGLGFFAQVLQECGLNVRAFDGREENVEEARRRYPAIPFERGDIQDPNIARFGVSDLVLCFGLLYHLENPLLAIRHLRELTGKALLLESMCLPEDKPWMLLREERSLEDQSLTDLAFYASEGCLAKMMYRAGFGFVYRLTELPDHDDFRDAPDHVRRRTVLLGTATAVDVPGFVLFPEPKETADPWSKNPIGPTVLPRIARRVRRFAGRPASEKYVALVLRLRRFFPRMLVPIRLPFGGWFLAGPSYVDEALFWGGFECAETLFVDRYLKPGMTVLDIGAHHGLYTLLASKRVGPTGKVISFEPSPRERRQLSRNLRLNFCSNVHVEPYALGRERSQTELFVVSGGEDGCNSLRPPVVDAETKPVRVDVVSLDEVVARIGLTRVDFLKLDVEGGELDVLKGASRVLQFLPRPVLLVEVYDIRTGPWGYRAHEIVRFLDGIGYRWFQLDDKGSLSRIAPDLEVYDANLVAIPEERVDQILQSAKGKDGN
jgi:FkbM family methyltransferase